jgi:NAD(P)-dependent dehydrogenase (short-subunit alcohol dehydrogenase family)
MSRSTPSSLLREGLLEGVSIMLACADRAQEGQPASPAAAVRALCASLGARVSDCPLPGEASAEAEEAAVGEAVATALGQAGAIDMLIVDGGSLFSARGAQGEEARRALVGLLESSWNVTRAVVNQAFLAQQRAGRVVYLAPAPDGGTHAGAACAGLENLARTLSIEWARHAITPVTIAPAADTKAEDLATLAAYLASPAGAYFSGCLLDLRGPAAS